MHSDPNLLHPLPSDKLEKIFSCSQSPITMATLVLHRLWHHWEKAFKISFHHHLGTTMSACPWCQRMFREGREERLQGTVPLLITISVQSMRNRNHGELSLEQGPQCQWIFWSKDPSIIWIAFVSQSSSGSQMQSRCGNRYPHCSASPLPPTALRKFLRLFPMSILLFSWVWVTPHACKVFAN